MKRHSQLPRSAHEELFRHEDDLVHAHFQREEQFHSDATEYFPLTVWLFAVEHRRNATSQVQHSHRLKTILRVHYFQLRLAPIDWSHMFVFDFLHEAMLAMNSHRAMKMHLNLRVRFESFVVEDLSYYKLDPVCKNSHEPG